MGFFGNNKNKEEKKKNKILQKAQKFARKGQTDKAVAEWESLLKNKSDDANVYNTIGDLYLKGNQKENALDAYRKACTIYSDSGFSLKSIAVNKKILKIDPHNLDALTAMAQLNQERGMLNNAKECYLSIAEYHIRTGGHDKALEAYQHLVDMEPKNLKVKLALAELYFKEQMVDDGTRIYGEVISALLEHAKYDDAEKLCKKLKETQPSNNVYMRYMIQIHLSRGQVDEAFAFFEQMEGKVDDDPEMALLNAEILIRKGEADEGLSIIQSIDRSAVTEFSRLKIFRFLLKAKNVEQALAVVDDLHETYSESQRLGDLLALFLQVLDQDADCLKARHRIVDILKKLKRDQELVQQYKEMGGIYAKTDQVDEARNIYEKVLDMVPGDLEVQAQLRELNGEPSQAEAPEFGEVDLVAGSSDEMDRSPQEDVAFVLDEMEDLETFASEEVVHTEVETFETTSSVVEFSPDQDETIEVVALDDPDRESSLADNITEADVYIKYGHMKKAMVHLEKNLGIDPKHVTTHERYLQIFVEQGHLQEQINTLMILAKLYKTAGENEKYDQALNEVIALDPGNEDAQRLIKEGPTALSSSAIDEAPAKVDNLNFEFDLTEETETTELKKEGQKIELLDDVVDDEGSIGELLDEANFYIQHSMADEAGVIYEKILSMHPHRTDIAQKLEMISKLGDDEMSSADEMTEDVPEASVEVIVESDKSSRTAEVQDESPAAAVSGDGISESQGSFSEEFSSFAEELRQEVDDSVSDILNEIEGDSGGTDDLLDFSSELRKEVEQSIASESPVFGESDVMDIFNEFREGVQRELGDEDHETHYNLGIAYLEMGLVDEAREEFSIAAQDSKRMMDCITMIGLCYIQKGEFQKAVAELDKGLSEEGRSDSEYIGIRYEIAKVSELLGNKDRAAQELLRIHEVDPRYRDVRSKLKALGVTHKEAASNTHKTHSKDSKVSYL